MKCEKTAKTLSCLLNLIEKRNKILEKYFTPILLLTIRIMIAMVFLKSGLTKIASFDSTIFLFENEYNVPLLNPVFAAYLTTFFELTCSIFLIIGLAARPAALILLALTSVIQFLVMPNPEHFYWMALLATIIAFGAGCFSFDYFIKKCAKKCSS